MLKNVPLTQPGNIEKYFFHSIYDTALQLVQSTPIKKANDRTELYPLVSVHVLKQHPPFLNPSPSPVHPEQLLLANPCEKIKGMRLVLLLSFLIFCKVLKLKCFLPDLR